MNVAGNYLIINPVHKYIFLMWNLEGFDVAKLQVTPEQREEIAALKQGSPEWKASRYGRLTASNFGAAAGHHVPGSRRKLLEAMLWPEHHALDGRAAQFAAYGTLNEPVARDVYITDRKSRGVSCVRVFETGLLVSLEHGWLGSSPDFIVEEYTELHERKPSCLPIPNSHHSRMPYTIDHLQGAHHFIENTPLIDPPAEPFVHTLTRGCGEIKCPATQKLYSQSPKHAKYGFPEYYYDQIQGIMAINSWPWCDTVVYTPYQTEVIRFDASPEYWEKELFPALKDFYFNDFLPRLNLRVQGKLGPGQIDPILEIPACVLSLGIDMTIVPKKKKKSK